MLFLWLFFSLLFSLFFSLFFALFPVEARFLVEFGTFSFSPHGRGARAPRSARGPRWSAVPASSRPDRL
ncbi:hypothetical protein [Streptomyces sp. S465]|uniref:hypothetical protein n=1 Tax=Streptomyces sp. S465 TaxID=2979468 RepID=UPI0022A8B100|nr:hypothetical protein [Streptomyces sp. S465]WAP54182.1 hypothetical protein N6H00_03920 [Streptomyces sp. S465]